MLGYTRGLPRSRELDPLGCAEQTSVAGHIKRLCTEAHTLNRAVPERSAQSRVEAYSASRDLATDRRLLMYHHVKKLMYTVRVDEPDPKFGNMLLEQFGGANGELAAAMQYSIQGLNCEDPARKDLLMDIGTEELSHLEVVGTLARLHLAPMKFKRGAAEADPLIAIAGGGGINLFNSMGNPWTADYLKITGELDVDLRNNIAAEGARQDCLRTPDQLLQRRRH